MNKKEPQKNEPIIAPGMDVNKELNRNATVKEVEKGEYTNVITLSYDEVDPS
nr:hypothetical protein [uncultured Bacillus sp.]